MSAQSPSREDVRAAVLSALEGALNAESMADFLAAVNWGEIDRDSDVAPLLGSLESWATEFREGDLSPANYAQRLQSLISVTSTSRH